MDPDTIGSVDPGPESQKGPPLNRKKSKISCFQVRDSFSGGLDAFPRALCSSWRFNKK